MLFPFPCSVGRGIIFSIKGKNGTSLFFKENKYLLLKELGEIVVISLQAVQGGGSDWLHSWEFCWQDQCFSGNRHRRQYNRHWAQLTNIQEGNRFPITYSSWPDNTILLLNMALSLIFQKTKVKTLFPSLHSVFLTFQPVLNSLKFSVFCSCKLMYVFLHPSSPVFVTTCIFTHYSEGYGHVFLDLVLCSCIEKMDF